MHPQGTDLHDFYPRPPRGGRRPAGFGLGWDSPISIHALLAEGDSLRRLFLRHSGHFYPRPPRGGRPPNSCRAFSRSHISIHALLAEGDTPYDRPAASACHFYPRPPRGGRHVKPCGKTSRGPFLSTPSSRRATATANITAPPFTNFYPRPPRGGRRQKRRKTSPLLFHYKTICTDLEELFQKHPKKEPRSAQNGLKTWCEGDGKGVSAFHSH